MKHLKTLTAAALALSATFASAQVAIKTDAGDLKITFKGRTHFDAGIYGGDLGKNSHDNVTNVVRLNDTRFGFIATFDEKWTVKAEYKFTGSTTSFTDLWFGYKINDKSSLQLGNYWMPFGYKILGPAYRFIQNSSIDEAIDIESRKMGLSYCYNTTPLKFTIGVFSDGNVNSIKENQGYNIAAKLIVRPVVDEHTILHFGIAPMLTHTPRPVSFNTSSLTQGRKLSLISKTFNDDQQYNIVRTEAEAIFISGKLYAEGRYQHAQINTPGEDNETVGGFFIQGGFLLVGEQQNYNKANAYATNLSPKNLELTARFGHVSYNQGEDRQESENDITVGLNYAFNKYLMTKLNWTHGQAHAEDEAVDYSAKNYNAVECRLQFVF